MRWTGWLSSTPTNSSGPWARSVVCPPLCRVWPSDTPTWARWCSIGLPMGQADSCTRSRDWSLNVLPGMRSRTTSPTCPSKRFCVRANLRSSPVPTMCFSSRDAAISTRMVAPDKPTRTMSISRRSATYEVSGCAGKGFASTTTWSSPTRNLISSNGAKDGHFSLGP